MLEDTPAVQNAQIGAKFNDKYKKKNIRIISSILFLNDILFENKLNTS